MTATFSNSELGEELGMSASGASYLRNGQRLPSPEIQQVIATRFGIPLGSGSLTPYSSLGLSFENASFGSTSDNGVGVPLTLGAEYRPNATLGIVGQFLFQFGDSFQDDVTFGLGVNLPF